VQKGFNYMPKIIKICKECGKDFKCYLLKNRKFCSYSCSQSWNNKNNPNVGFKKGHKSGMTGKHHTKETGIKIGKANIGRKKSVEEIESIKKRMLGNNYGKANKGKKRPPFSKEWRDNIGKAGKGKNMGNKNPAKRPEVRKKISKKRSGQRLGEQSVEHKRKIREWHINNPNKVFKDTKIELKMEVELKRQDINYEKQIPLCSVAIVDFFLPKYEIVIQCDGCFWHGCPIHNLNWIKNKERNANQDKILKENGYIVYRFWEHEINENVKECVNKIRELNK
jgi:DNA mismatch endonuclease (patch repair protein)